jgi:hypothetical protein
MRYYFSWAVGLTALTLLLSGCFDDGGSGGNDSSSPAQAIAGTWFVRDSTDVTIPESAREVLDLTNFRITVTPTLTRVNYTTAGSTPAVFPPQGTLVVDDDADFRAGAEVLRQPDLVVMDMIVPEDTTLRIEFNIGMDSSIPANNSRVARIEGGYVFVLRKQE